MSTIASSTHPAAKTALVTGASRGIGAAIAVALAERGIASVLAVRDPDAARETVRAVQALGVSCTALRCDVADAAAVRQAVLDTLAAHGRLDAVVNNAGQIDPIGHLADTDPADWARAVSTNLVGCYHVLHAALPALLESKGAVVNLSTGAAHTPREGWSAYCSSKAALAMLTRCVAHEYAARGVRAYGLQPGLVDTAMQDRIRGSGMNEISRVPKDSLVSPRRPARLVAWLCDDGPQDLVGQDLTVNDAQLMQRAGIGA